MNKFMKALGAASFFAASASASALTVGVATWDPNYNNAPFSEDFNDGGQLAQFFTSNDNSGLQSVSGVDIANVIDANIVTQGSFLTGVGVLSPFNSGTGSICAGCELTYAFGGLKLNADLLSFDTTNAWFTVYSDVTADFIPQDASSYANAQDGDVFLTGTLASFFIDSGNLVTGSSEGLINVNGGMAFEHFDTNLQLGGTDLKLSGTGNFLNNPFFSNAGQITLVGDTIPEPTSLALLGLGLLGFGVASRRKVK